MIGRREFISDAGTVRPSVFAVFKLIASTN